MKLAKVIGHLVATVKTESHRNKKLMVVEPVDLKGNAIDASFIAIDAAHAGIGDIVLIVEEGGSAREVLQLPNGAVDAVIVGVVDYIEKDD